MKTPAGPGARSSEQNSGTVDAAQPLAEETLPAGWGPADPQSAAKQALRAGPVQLPGWARTSARRRCRSVSPQTAQMGRCASPHLLRAARKGVPKAARRCPHSPRRIASRMDPCSPPATAPSRHFPAPWQEPPCGWPAPAACQPLAHPTSFRMGAPPPGRQRSAGRFARQPFAADRMEPAPPAAAACASQTVH